MIKETEGLKDISLNCYCGIRFIEYSSQDDSFFKVGWKIVGELFLLPTAPPDNNMIIEKSQIDLEIFIEKMPSLLQYKIHKEVADEITRIGFTAKGLDVESFDKFLSEEGEA